MAYLDKYWACLARYIERGYLPIDNATDSIMPCCERWLRYLFSYGDAQTTLHLVFILVEMTDTYLIVWRRLDELDILKASATTPIQCDGVAKET